MSIHYYKFIDHELKRGCYYYRLKQIDINGSFNYSDFIEVRIGIPKTYDLGQNFPNPFNPETTIKYQIPEHALVKLEIFNTLGQRIKVLVNEDQPAGYYKVNWNGNNDQGFRFSTGIYFYRLTTHNFKSVKKMLIIQ